MELGARVTVTAAWSDLDGQEGTVGDHNRSGNYLVNRVDVESGKTGWFVDAELVLVAGKAAGR